MKPLAIELFAGTGSGTAGWCDLGGEAVCFDLEYLPHHGPAPARSHRVIQNVMTLHGSQFKDAAFIWASPPCQSYSWLAQPWSRSAAFASCLDCRGTGLMPPAMEDYCDRCEGTGELHNSKAAKALRKKWETEGPDNRLFDACFRIQREAIEATRPDCPVCDGQGVDAHLFAYRRCRNCGGVGRIGVGRYIPLIVENVRGAIPWVGKRDMPLDEWNRLSQAERIERGRPQAAFGSFMLWGDVARIGNRVVASRDLEDIRAGRGRMGMGVAPEGCAEKVPGQIQGKEYAMCRTGASGQKVLGYSDPRRNGGKGVHLTSPAENAAGTKIGGDWFSDPNSTCRKHGSKSNARKAASALIARIPTALSEYIARINWPADVKFKGGDYEKLTEVQE